MRVDHRATATVADTAPKGRILLADDEIQVLRAYTRALSAAGYWVECAPNGKVAAELLRETRFDVVVSDIAMPKMTGLQLLRAVREYDLDVPVILITGTPALDSALEAIEQGAFLYLVKPVQLAALEDAIGRAIRLHQIAKMKREAVTLLGSLDKLVGDRAGLFASFERALRGSWMAFQPIVDWNHRRIFGYEALLRSREPVLPHPGAILDAAERLARVSDVGRTVRSNVAARAGELGDANIFVNLHAQDLSDPLLLSGEEALAQLASRVVLEITERAALDKIKDVRLQIARLKKIGFRVAVDDLGAGYAGLTAFAQLEPEIVKLDRELVRNVHDEPTKRKIVGSMTKLCKELNILVVAEGVETVAERECLTDLGCDLLQGYLFAKPAWPVNEVSW